MVKAKQRLTSAQAKLLAEQKARAELEVNLAKTTKMSDDQQKRVDEEILKAHEAKLNADRAKAEIDKKIEQERKRADEEKAKKGGGGEKVALNRAELDGKSQDAIYVESVALNLGDQKNQGSKTVPFTVQLAKPTPRRLAATVKYINLTVARSRSREQFVTNLKPCTVTYSLATAKLNNVKTLTPNLSKDTVTYLKLTEKSTKSTKTKTVPPAKK